MNIILGTRGSGKTRSLVESISYSENTPVLLSRSISQTQRLKQEVEHNGYNDKVVVASAADVRDKIKGLGDVHIFIDELEPVLFQFLGWSDHIRSITANLDITNGRIITLGRVEV